MNHIPYVRPSWKRYLVVRLDDPLVGAGPATIVEVVDVAVPIRQTLVKYTDRDGAKDPRIKIWRGIGRVGERCRL